VRPVEWHRAETRAFDLPPGSVIQVSGSGPIAAQIANALNVAGYAARAVDEPDGYAAAVIITEGLDKSEPAARHWTVLQRAKQARRAGGMTLLVQSSANASGLDGLSRTLRKEWPECLTFAWTLADLPEPAGAIANSVRSGFGDGALGPQGCFEPETGETLMPPPVPAGDSSSVWLITGGARGVTAACAIELARTDGGTILLAGRSAEEVWPAGLPMTRDIKTLRGLLFEQGRQSGARMSPVEIDRKARALLASAEIRETVAAINAAGATAVYLPLDAGNRAAVSEALTLAQGRYGPITGLVHGAGVLADRLAADKTEAELRRVFAPKVDGLNNILSAIRAEQLKHVAFFSSAAAFFGNRGQADYAMANALLASAGRSLARTYPDMRVKVFHWGPWAGGMVDASLAGHFEAQGIPLIPIDEGARIFVGELLGGNREQVELVIGEAWAAA
jgi:NAD(P)-dependent dehydrogenase (short-subunit alcohol dehydrogenase family)